MRTFVRNCGVLSLAVILAAPALAADKAKKAAKSPGTQTALGFLKGIELTDEQKTKIAEIGKSFDEKLAAAKALMPADVMQARQEATKQAKAAGKKGKEVKEAVDAAVVLTDAQKQSITAAQNEMKAVTKALREAVIGVLTEEQKAKLPGKKKKAAA